MNLPYIGTVRKGTAEEWEASTYVLKKGEPALDVTNYIIKYGNGTSVWKDLPIPYNTEYAPASYATEDDISGLFNSSAS